MNSDERRGWLLGLLGVAVFGLTLPMTRLATGSLDAPQLSPWFVTWARAAIAGGLSLAWLWATRAPRPRPEHRRPLALAVLGNVIGFPLLLGWALRHVTASHAAVFTALLPLATAAMAAWLMHQRARLGFWLFAGLGSALVVAYSLLRAHQAGHGFGLSWADTLLVGAVLAAALGYVGGTQVTPALGAERVISWVCALALPITLPAALLTWPERGVNPSAWLGLAYVAVFSMWAGFFAWFRGLSLGGPLRVSQLQLLQPFISIAAAVPLLGERLDALTLVFALAVVASVFAGRRFGAAPPAPSPSLHKAST
ncbi:MAG: DMT family transporter [Comamonadaceae bacterium]|jgi:drug/metabolite transporter (DMT)-like permease|uniref:DMT family transporter n=1 Tax=Hydrogenophaga borbori TaxID=2294117 RepID=A0A372EKP2_9BURK|nr:MULTISPECIES: DMT family transporter [Hydrogenophaga]NCT99633.1 DMT family transporter [Comamonadaceae bacterium]RFP79654.1 DMT family transporter [Hydrogenophaga borbori]WQB84122.1 DMT family transporter [Hydrogenophaga sp. SNF1]